MKKNEVTPCDNCIHSRGKLLDKNDTITGIKCTQRGNIKIPSTCAFKKERAKGNEKNYLHKILP
jgi:hypothetical protein